MGQILSALRACIEIVNYFRWSDSSTTCQNSDTQTRVPLPPDAMVVTEMAIETPEDKDLRVPSSSRVADVEPVRVGLPDFPAEIIMIVAQYLPPSSFLSLTYSCRNIRNKMGVSIEESLGKKVKMARLSRLALKSNLPKFSEDILAWSSPTMVREIHHSERLQLLCMLDRDRKIPPSKAVCSACADTHDRSLFSSESLTQSSCERRCLGSAGRVWVCPHWVFDHNLVTTSAEPKGVHMCGEKMDVLMLARNRAVTVPTVMWPIMVLRDNHHAPSKKLVKELLARIDLSVCKHLSFADDFVSGLYSPDCKKLRVRYFDPFCRCSTCRWQPPARTLAELLDPLEGGNCESCGTNVHFHIFMTSSSQWILQLVVQRKIASFKGCTDPAWIEQVTDPSEFKKLERKWYKATDEDIGLV